MKELVNRYLDKHSLHQSFNVLGVLPQKKDSGCVAVVIPVKDEYPDLFLTLQSLAKSLALCEKKTGSKDFYVVCVVNGKSDDSEQTKENNKKCLELLLGNDPGYILPELCITVLDCATKGCEIPCEHGVGFARKLGMDFALSCGATTIACLDSDTLVSENYCQQLFDFDLRHDFPYSSPKSMAAAVTDFFHQKGATPAQDRAVKIYQNYMKEHSRHLKECGTIFYPVALGPTLVCTASAYVACGGMNLRTAGEDFYFLQSLIKTLGKPLPMLESMVFPSARESCRVPFGTGRAVKEICDYEEQPSNGETEIQFNPPLAVTGYPGFVYDQIKCLIRLVEESCEDPLDSVALEKHLSASIPKTTDFLRLENFFSVWEKLRKNNTSPQNLKRAFQCWLDGLKIIRLVHFLLR